MIPVATAEQIREAEQRVFAAQPKVDLMGRAARAVALAANQLASQGRVLVAVGPGNNGGDGLYAAAELAAEREVCCWLTADAGLGAAVSAAKQAGCEFVDATSALALLPECALVIDAVFGIGGRGGLKPVVATFAAACRDLQVPVLAVDLPSGLESEAAQPTAGESFHAARTVTFIAPKLCQLAPPSAVRCGEVSVVDIGVPVPAPELWQAQVGDFVAGWPWPQPTDDKYSRGVVGLDVGSGQYPGAALLGCLGARYAGAGMVRYLGPVAGELILGSQPSVVTAPGRVQALVVGSGWGEAEVGRWQAALDTGALLVVDAEALRLLPADLPEGSLLTPHPGELARLLGISRSQVEGEPLASARQAAQQHRATVLLKGATQCVATPEGACLLPIAGPAWTARAGAGDVLAGVCGALLAAGVPAPEAAVLGASLQAMTAAANPGPYPPEELAGRFPKLLGELEKKAGLAFQQRLS